MNTTGTDKVFGIGFLKTGTTTLLRMLQLLGYKACPEFKAYGKIENWIDKDYSTIIELAKPYEAFQDYPWCLPGMYEKLDNTFVNSKFILTLRDPDEWLKSLEGQWEKLCYLNIKPDVWTRFGKYNAKDLSRILYDCLPTNRESFIENEDKFLKVYNKYNKDAASYFKKKYGKNYDKKLLVVDFPSGDGWPQLLDFLPRNENNIQPNHPMLWKNKRKKGS